MSIPIEVDVAARLAAAGLGLTLNTNLFYGPLGDGGGLPDLAVSVHNSGGYPREPDLGGPSAPDLIPLTVQIHVRSAANSYDAGSTLMQAVCDAVHKQESGAANVSWLLQSSAYIGADNKGRHRWSVNFLCTRYE